MSGWPEVRGHTLSRAAVISRAGPHRNCLWMLQVFLSSTNLKQHRFPVRTEEPQTPHDSYWFPSHRRSLQVSSVSMATVLLLPAELRPHLRSLLVQQGSDDCASFGVSFKHQRVEVRQESVPHVQDVPRIIGKLGTPGNRVLSLVEHTRIKRINGVLQEHPSGSGASGTGRP